MPTTAPSPTMSPRNAARFSGRTCSRHSVSPQGDRLAFSRSSEDGTGNFVWTMPIDPQDRHRDRPGAAREPPANKRGAAVFSPDGKMLAFTAGPRPDGTWDLTLVPATGGPERVVANYPTRVGPHAWSADGKSLYVERPQSIPGPSSSACLWRVVEASPCFRGRGSPMRSQWASRQTRAWHSFRRIQTVSSTGRPRVSKERSRSPCRRRLTMGTGST